MKDFTDALQQRLEGAEIDDVRDLPVIAMVDAQDLPLHPDAPGTIGRALGPVAVMVALDREAMARAERGDVAEFEEFRREREQAFPRVWPWRRVRCTEPGTRA